MNNKLLTTTLYAGLAAAVLVFLFSLSLAMLDTNPFGPRKFLYIALYALPFIGGMLFFRNRQNNYRMKPQQGLVIGLGLSAVGSVVYGAMMYVFLSATELGQQALEWHREDSIALFERTNKELMERDPDQFEKIMEGNDVEDIYKSLQNFSAQDIAIDAGSGLILWGFFHTFLFMLIFKNG